MHLTKKGDNSSNSNSKECAIRKRPSSSAGSRCSSKTTASRRSHSTADSRRSSRGSLCVKSVTAAATSRVMAVLIRELYEAYDFLQQGRLSEEVFKHVYNIHNNADGRKQDASSAQLPQLQTSYRGSSSRSLLAQEKEKPPTAAAVWHRHASEGYLCFEGFHAWQLEVQDSKVGAPCVAQVRMAQSIRDLKDDLGRDFATGAWRELHTASKAAKGKSSAYPLEAIVDLEEALQKANPAMQRDVQYDNRAKQHLPCLEEPRSLVASWKQQYAESLETRLVEATTIGALEAALEAEGEAREKTDIEVRKIEFYRAELLRLQQPFALHVTTLAGAEATVQVNRTETIFVVKEKVAKAMDLKAYRLNLVCTSQKLEPETATLEELGFGTNETEKVAVFFGEINRWKEMSIPEFLELAVNVGAFSVAESELLQKQYDEGKISREAVQANYRTSRVVAKECELEVKRRREEESRLKAELAQKEAAAKMKRAKESLLAQAMGQSGNDSCLELRYLDDGSARLALLSLQRKAADADEKLKQCSESIEEAMNFLQQRLEHAMPALEDGVNALRVVNKRDYCEIKSFSRPPPRLILVMEALCILFEVKPIAVRDMHNPGRKVADYWEPARRLLLSDTRLIEKMLDFDKDDIFEVTIRKLQRYMDDEEFTPERMAMVSHFGSAICRWIRGVVMYHHARAELAPELAHLKSQQEEFEAMLYHKRVIKELTSEVQERMA
eukprot:CAMPEP_0172763940 /NCGR_PEP_ID=MMETSP1074-20121228/176347_1 /TAXON_ID=2916 /ORGANISM="Ceratium fusus, Strain PA161109" /LENGTH=725 /DNA_ID=CAMNT_0013598625 /DNA_START=17 /DNA_END=2194 /DNA_ORIENTATION=-